MFKLVEKKSLIMSKSIVSGDQLPLVLNSFGHNIINFARRTSGDAGMFRFTSFHSGPLSFNVHEGGGDRWHLYSVCNCNWTLSTSLF